MTIFNVVGHLVLFSSSARSRTPFIHHIHGSFALVVPAGYLFISNGKSGRKQSRQRLRGDALVGTQA